MPPLIKINTFAIVSKAPNSNFCRGAEGDSTSKNSNAYKSFFAYPLFSHIQLNNQHILLWVDVAHSSIDVYGAETENGVNRRMNRRSNIITIETRQRSSGGAGAGVSFGFCCFFVDVIVEELTLSKETKTKEREC